MNYTPSLFRQIKSYANTVQRVADDLRTARAQLAYDRAEALAALNRLFRNGRMPQPPLDGRYRGELVVINIAPGLTELIESISGIWMPWLGKTFSASRQNGDNIFTRDSYAWARFFNPFYRGYVNDEPTTYRAFAFRTYVAPGLADPDRQVLKIDYDLKENPALTIRRVLDELVQVDDNLYLGKAHVQWWWGRWQTVAYFTLTPIVVSFPNA